MADGRYTSYCISTSPPSPTTPSSACGCETTTDATSPVTPSAYGDPERLVLVWNRVEKSSIARASV